MKDSTEEIRGRSGSRVKIYAGVALVAIAVRCYPACVKYGNYYQVELAWGANSAFVGWR